MGEFTGDWLTLREPADVAARSERLTQVVAHALDAAGTGTLRVLDLGAGTGANLRYLTERLPPRQDWLLVDHDAGLLGSARERLRTWGSERGYTAASESNEVTLTKESRTCRITTSRMDLGRLERPAIFADRTLVTASALCDLVSADWLLDVARLCHAHRAAVLFALTYDGRITCVPSEPEDERVRELVNRHQRTEKTFGPALGPDAIVMAERFFREHGYQVQREASDWRLGSEATELQRELITGWADAAVAMAPEQTPIIRRWLHRRLDHVEGRRSELLVGHQDFVAVGF